MTESLGMPKGSVHALLAIGITGFSGYCVARGINVPEWWQIINYGALGGYSVYRHVSPSQFSGKTDGSQVNLDEVDLMKRENK